jgi:F-type H+-transporting ATPase subunit delta
VAEAVAAKRYAEALLRLAHGENETEKFEHDIEFIIQTLKADVRLPKIFTHPRIRRAHKLELIDKLWKPYICKTVYNFMRLLIENRRIYELSLILKRYQIEVKKLKGIYLADVHTAFALESAQSEQLRLSLEKLSGLKLEIKNKVKPEIIGGILVRIGDDVIDWRVSRMLNTLNEKLRRDELIGLNDSGPEAARIIDVERQ